MGHAYSLRPKVYRAGLFALDDSAVKEPLYFYRRDRSKFGMQMSLRNWKMSSYINALIDNGMEIEKIIETSAHYDRNAEYSEKYYSEHKARFINHSFVIKARKRC